MLICDYEEKSNKKKKKLDQNYDAVTTRIPHNQQFNLLLDRPVFITLKTSSSPTAFTLGSGTSHLPWHKNKSILQLDTL